MKILLQIFLQLLSLFPFNFQMFLGKLLGRLLYKVLKKRKKVVTWNIQKCFPDFSESETIELAKENFVRIGQAIFEICNSYYWSDKKFISKIKI